MALYGLFEMGALFLRPAILTAEEEDAAMTGVVENLLKRLEKKVKKKRRRKCGGCELEWLKEGEEAALGKPLRRKVDE